MISRYFRFFCSWVGYTIENLIKNYFSCEILDSTQVEKLGEFRDIIREVSSQKLSDQNRDAIVEIKEVDNPYSSIYGQWMTIILVSGSKVKISFKAHFKSSDSINHLANKTKKKSEDILLKKSFDLLKEFSNLVGGGIKESLGKENDVMGLSLPLLTRGFDEVLFTDRIRRSGKHKHRDVWSLKAGNVNIVCTTEIQVIDWTGLEDLASPDRNEEEEGDLEFL